MMPVSFSAYGSYSGNFSPASSASGSFNTEGASSVVRNPSASRVKSPGRESSPAECKTCSSRKYQDGSDENVSFKAAAHISPQASASVVRAHEQEHVSNAYTKAAKNNGKVIAANVSLQTAICPECGRSYVSGGTTHTQIKYYNEENPYQKDLKLSDSIKYKGRSVNLWG